MMRMAKAIPLRGKRAFGPPEPTLRQVLARMGRVPTGEKRKRRGATLTVPDSVAGFAALQQALSDKRSLHFS